MKRKTFDLIRTSVGAVLVVALAAAGALLLWASSWTSNNVRSQLEKQQITFPTAAAFANAKPGTEITPTMKPYLLQYAGQQLLNGTQAEAYADHFIAVHLSEMPYQGVYSKISTVARTQPNNASLKALEATSFQGTTLRSMLLEAYGFGMFGQIAWVSAIVAFVLAAFGLVLTVLGYLHWRRTSPSVEL